METNLWLELQKIDTNGKKWLEGKEIDKFLENEENLRQLWEIIQNQFGAETGELLEFKEDIWKICDRILKLKENNNTKNQQIILLF